MRLPEDWPLLVEPLIGNAAAIKEIKESWRTAFSIQSLVALHREGTTDWPCGVKYDKRMRLGIYTPLQLIAAECAQDARTATDLEFPFNFTVVAMLARVLISDDADDGGETPREPDFEWPLPEQDYAEYRKVLQSVFQLRELREERQPLSIEVRLPLETKETSLKAKDIGKMFGRGVAISSGNGLSSRSKSRTASLIHLFKDHDTAPASALYELGAPMEHIQLGKMHIILRRDGHVVISGRANPVFEFYDGGWHMADIAAARQALRYMLGRVFGENVDPRIEFPILHLAYHMASHWHGGIIAIVDEKKKVNRKTLSEILDESKYAEIKRAAIAASSIKVDDVLVNALGETGLGRVILTSAIQDGAILFSPQGQLISANQMVLNSQGIQEGGARRRAAKALSRYGVVLAVSQDGAIRIFCTPGKNSLVPDDGLRIR